MPQNNSSSSLATTSNNSGQVRPELMPESQFYLESSNFTQSSSERFGIVESGGVSTFRTTSKISGYNGKIYTICQGQIFVQPNSSDSTKVNVILKPFGQPIKGLAIKYFIYRGLSKSDFFDNDLIKTNGSGVSGFIQYIRQDFEQLYGTNGANTTPPPFYAKFIGYPSNAPGEEQNVTDLIDDFFLKISHATGQTGSAVEQDPKKAFELPMIPRGTSLGNVSGGIGIDIVLNEGDYTIEDDPNPFKLDLNFARLADHVLSPSSVSNDFHKKLIRESATSFLDIAAFYGLHAYGKGKLYVAGQNTPLQNKDDIYNCIRNFATANTSYLYIQSNRQRSYNFYNNYTVEGTTNNIKIGTSPTSLSDAQFDSNWPLLEINNTQTFVIQLVTDNNANAGLYVKQGLLSNDTRNEDYFIRNENLLQQNNSSNNLHFTKPLSFDFIKTSNNSIVSSVVQIIYEGCLLPAKNEALEDVYMKDIDDLFGLINVVPHIQAKTPSELHYIIDQNLLLINFENKTGGQDIATVTTKRTEDLVMKDETTSLKRITYESLLNNIRQNTGSFFESRSAYIDNSNSGTVTYESKLNNFYRPEKPYYLKTEIFTGSDGNTITGLSLQVEDGTLPSKKLLGITDVENTIFTTLIDSHDLNNPKFFFKNELEDEESYYISSEGTSYKRYSLCVIGETQTGGLLFFEPATKLYVSTIDNMIYASEEYSKWLPALNLDNIGIIKLKL